MAETLIRVMLVDDHAVVRTGYRMLLEMDGGFSVAAEAGSGEEATAQYAACRPDAVVIDLNLPGISGIEVIRRIRQFDPGARMLVFSIHDESVYVLRALDAGASGYLCKSCAPAQMVEAVRVIAGGGRYIDPGLALPCEEFHRTFRDPMTTLSAREFEVFQLLGRGLGSREIGETLALSAKTVSNYLLVIKEKLAVSSTAELIRLAAGLAIGNGAN